MHDNFVLFKCTKLCVLPLLAMLMFHYEYDQALFSCRYKHPYSLEPPRGRNGNCSSSQLLNFCVFEEHAVYGLAYTNLHRHA